MKTVQIKTQIVYTSPTSKSAEAEYRLTNIANSLTTKPVPWPIIHGLSEVLDQVADEVVAQIGKWGVQNHPSAPETYVAHLEFAITGAMSDNARDETEKAAAADELTWAHVMHEEVAEAMQEVNNLSGKHSKEHLQRLRAELIQVAAVAVSWVNSIDRNGV